MRSAVMFVLCGVAIAVNGCGSSSGSGGTGGSGGTAASGTGGSAGSSGSGGSTGAGGALASCGDSMGTGQTCTSVTATAVGPCVTATISTGTVPVAAGGTVSNGTYELTSIVFYGTAVDAGNNGNLETQRETFVVKNATASSFTLDQIKISGTYDDTEEGTVAISGTTVTYTPTCPPPGDAGNHGGSASFTATSATFTLIMSQSGGTVVEVFTKQ